MKKKNLFTLLPSLSLAAGLLLGSCASNSEDPLSNGGEGTLRFNISAPLPFQATQTRAVNEEDYKNTDNYTVQILDGQNGIVKEGLYKDIKGTTYQLNNGTYTIKAFYGEESNASQEKFLVTGEVHIDVAANDQAVNVDCYPTCGKLRAYFDATMSEYFSAYSITYETEALVQAGAAVNWTQTNTIPWYVKLNPKGEKVKATIHLTRKDDGTSSQVVREYTGMKPNQSWTMNIAPLDDNGSLGITIDIDETTTDIEHDIEVPSDWI